MINLGKMVRTLGVVFVSVILIAVGIRIFGKTDAFLGASIVAFVAYWLFKARRNIRYIDSYRLPEA